jgi:molecular chaperone GrpE
MKKDKKQTKKEPDVTQLNQQLGEYKLHLQRLQADFENYIKRSTQEKDSFKNFIESQVLKNLLPIADDFERTIESIKESEDIKQIQEAINIIFKNFTKTLEKNQLTPFKSKGEKVDPNKHEVIQIEEGEEDDIVLEELQKGYTHKNKVLRPAIVKVSKKKSINESKDSGEKQNE